MAAIAPPNDIHRAARLVLIPAALVAAVAVGSVRVGELKYMQEHDKREPVRQDRARQQLRRTLDRGLHGQFDSAVRRMRDAKVSCTTPELKQQWDATMAALFHVYGDGREGRSKRNAYRLAYAYYRQAMVRAPDEGARQELRRRQAQLLIGLEEWQEAIDQLTDVIKAAKLPITRHEARLDLANCLGRLEREPEAVDLLAEIEAAAKDPGVRARAMMTKASIIARASREPQILARFAAQKPTAIGDLRVEAERLYARQVQTSTDMQATAEARLGLLELAVDRQDHDRVYQLANQVQLSFESAEVKARVLQLIANLHIADGEEKMAIASLERCVANYAETIDLAGVLFRLYRLHRDKGNWEDALGLAERIALAKPERKRTIALLDDFLPGVEGGFLEYLGRSAGKKKLWRRVTYLLRAVADACEDGRSLVRDRVGYLHCALAFAAEDYQEAERQLAVYASRELLQGYLEEALYLDLLCGQKLQRPLAIRALRARRYLAAFPSGANNREALVELLRTYYEMELYEAAMNVARKTIIQELVTMGQEELYRDNDHWLHTVAKIGQCYDKLGLPGKANVIFRHYSQQILERPYAAEIFGGWGGIAAEQGQNHEAIRRYDLAIAQADDKAHKLRLQLARNMRALHINLPGAYTELRRWPQIVLQADCLTEPLRQELLKDCYEALLAYVGQHRPEELGALQEELLKWFPNESWTDYWLMRTLNFVAESGDLTDLRRNYEKVSEARAKEVASGTTTFLRNQMELVDNISDMRARIADLHARGLTP